MEGTRTKVSSICYAEISLFATEWKRCLDRESNPGTLAYKINALPLSYLGRQPVSIFSLIKPVNQSHLDYNKDSSTEWATGNGNTTIQWDKDYCY